MLRIDRVGPADLPQLSPASGRCPQPMLRAYCDFYRVDPPDDGLVALETAPDNVGAQRLYDGIGAKKSTWLTYELDAG